MADSQKKSAQLFDKSGTVYQAFLTETQWLNSSDNRSVKIPCQPNTTYTISVSESLPIFRIATSNNADIQPQNDIDIVIRTTNKSQYTFTTSSTAQVIIFQGSTSMVDIWLNSLMCNEGSQPLPYEPYSATGWLHSLRKLTTATEAVENPLYSDGTAITAYTIKGNTVQNGTPSQSNPVMPQGTGDKSDNLWNEDYTGISDTVTYKALYVGDGTFTLSTSMPAHTVEGTLGYFTNLFFLSGNVSTGASTGGNGVWYNHSITQNAIDGYVTIAYRNEVDSPSDYETMLNTGSTAKPYEPYGYKIPISNGGVTTNIDLGSTQTVREIKKLVLDGTESWTYEPTYSRFYISVNDFISLGLRTTPFVSNSFGSISDGRPIADVPDNTIYSGSNSGADVNKIYIKCTSYTSADEFKSYLQQQYVSNTPVTVWYVLATAETAAVNEPLMKIGDYADTLSNAASIPTTEGANTITVDTTVQPSEFTATWTGWHNASVKEYDGSDWQ